jgi:hypothetical protein
MKHIGYFLTGLVTVIMLAIATVIALVLLVTVVPAVAIVWAVLEGIYNLGKEVIG